MLASAFIEGSFELYFFVIEHDVIILTTILFACHKDIGSLFSTFGSLFCFFLF